MPEMRNLWDLQTLLYVVCYTMLMVVLWKFGFSWPLYIALLFLTISMQVIHHNQVHLGIWRHKPLNNATNFAISILTAVPSEMMIGGHLKNHHRHQHGPADLTRTYRFGGDHNHALGYFLHPFQAFGVLIPKFWRDFLEGWPQRSRFSKNLLLQVILIGITWIALALIDWQKFLLIVLIPQGFGLHWLLGANYLQHAHCDDESKANYARNFTGAVNLVWFNIGFHTVHHDHPRAHWSTLRQLHQQHYDHVDPQLCQKSLLGYVVRTFVIGSFLPSFRSQSLKAGVSVTAERLSRREHQ